MVWGVGVVLTERMAWLRSQDPIKWQTLMGVQDDRYMEYINIDIDIDIYMYYFTLYIWSHPTKTCIMHGPSVYADRACDISMFYLWCVLSYLESPRLSGRVVASLMAQSRHDLLTKRSGTIQVPHPNSTALGSHTVYGVVGLVPPSIHSSGLPL
jgi:hypothetical protein